jgi:hypothetical protein
MFSVTDGLAASSSTGSFSVETGSSCNVVTTHHKCLAAVTVEGMPYVLGCDRACFKLISGLCNATFGNESFFQAGLVLIRRNISLKN